MNARNVKNYTNNIAAEALEQALQTFETNMAAIRAEREKLESQMYDREHELNHEWEKGVVTPGVLSYDFDSFTSGAVSVPTVSKGEWQQQRHAIMAALSANPFGDADRAALAMAQIDAISAAAAETDAGLTADLVDAQKAMQAAQARYIAAVNARKDFRISTIGRVRRAYENTTRSCRDAGAVWGGYRAEGLNEPHTSAILSAVNSHGSVVQAMDTMKDEIKYHAEQAAKSRSVPERVEYIEAPHFKGSIASPSDLAQIGANYHNNIGLRGWLGGMLGK